MNYITLDYIKGHSRLDTDEEDDLLTIYANSAEDTVMNICNTTYEKMVATYGLVPNPILQATLMLVEVAITNRSPISQANFSVVPYTFDLLVKPYIVLADETDESSSDEL